MTAEDTSPKHDFFAPGNYIKYPQAKVFVNEDRRLEAGLQNHHVLVCGEGHLAPWNH